MSTRGGANAHLGSFVFDLQRFATEHTLNAGNTDLSLDGVSYKFLSSSGSVTVAGDGTVSGLETGESLSCTVTEANGAYTYTYTVGEDGILTLKCVQDGYNTVWTRYKIWGEGMTFSGSDSPNFYDNAYGAVCEPEGGAIDLSPNDSKEILVNGKRAGGWKENTLTLEEDVTDAVFRMSFFSKFSYQLSIQGSHKCTLTGDWKCGGIKTTEGKAFYDGSALTLIGGTFTAVPEGTALRGEESITLPGGVVLNPGAEGRMGASLPELTGGSATLAKDAGIAVGSLGTITNNADSLVTVDADGKLALKAGQSVTTEDEKGTVTYTMSEDGTTLTVRQGGDSKEWNVADSQAGVAITMVADGPETLSGATSAGGEDNTGDNTGGDNTGGDNTGEDSPGGNTEDSTGKKDENIVKTKEGETTSPKDYDAGKDVIELAGATGSLEADKILVNEDGTLTYGEDVSSGNAANGTVDLSGSKNKGFYVVRIADKDGRNEQLAAWSGTQSATVDMRQETKGVIMKDGGNGKQDTFLGGKGKDDITLGYEDVAAGGKGNDNITMGKDASGAAVALKDGDGHDKVEGFQFGFGEEANAVSLRDGQSMSGVSVDSSGRLKVGTATLEFSGTDLKNSGQTDLLLKDSHGTHKAAVGTSLTAGDELADIYYGTDKEAEVDFSDSGESGLVIDLNNSSSYGKTTASVLNVQKVKGSENADNTMVGQDGKNNTLIAGDGGSNRLYGGKGGRDRMVGSSTSEDTFYFGADSGRDEIENFGEEDAIGLLGGSLSQAAFDEGGRLKLDWQDEKGNSSRLVFADDMKDKAISYDLGDGLHGAKFGEKLTVTDDTADFVDYYSSGSKEGDGELDISGSSDKKAWLDGSHGAVFDGFNKVDASESTGNLELAGGEQGDSILGGQGESSLWGGAGGNDFLTGGSGYNEFYFGKGEGHDVITDSNSGDKVMLYNVAVEDLDLARTGMDASGNMVIRLLDGSSLTIQNYSAQGASTFQLADSTWSYDRARGAWSQE